MLAERARELGIEMDRAKRPEAHRDTPIPGRQEPFKSIREYEEGELNRVGVPISEPSENVLSFMQAHGAAIDQTIKVLVESEPPRWTMDVSKGPEAPIPNLLGILRIQRVLSAEALMRAGRGDDAGSEKAMLASWNLNASLRDRPELITQLVAGSITRMQAGLARRLPVISEAGWKKRFQDHDYRASMLDAMVVAACGHLATFPADRSTFNRASRADLMDLQRRFLVSLRDSPLNDERNSPFDRVASKQPDPLSAGEILGSMALPIQVNAWRRVDRLIIDLELTHKVLEAKEQRARLGHWPTQIPGLEQSRMRGVRWVYSVSPSGRMSIVFSGNQDSCGQQGLGLTLPLEYVAD